MGENALAELSAIAGMSGVFVDFDGTLSEIAPTPEAAVPVPGTAEALTSLARRFSVVAVVSGRQVSELERLLGTLQSVRLFGLYGAEDRPAGRENSRSLEEILPRVMELAAGMAGTLVEPKGSNIAVHYRLAPDSEAARAELLETMGRLADSSGMKLIEGKQVVELIPPDSPTKGDLVRREGTGLRGVLYAGDDLADLEAFSAVDVMAGEGATGVKVAVRSAETPRALVEAADLVVDGPPGLLELLGSLA